jgi:hypothetical protein
MNQIQTRPADLTQSVAAFMDGLNWDNRVTVLPSTTPPEMHSFGIPTSLMDWSVEQFFASFHWSGNSTRSRLNTHAAVVQEEPEIFEAPFTLSDFSNLF